MRKILSCGFAVVALCFFCVRAEEPVGTIPDFAVARVTIGKIGSTRDMAGAYSNQIYPNVGPMVKMVLANVFFTVPFDNSLDFDGAAVMYVLPPFKATLTPDTATILPVKDAAALKKNVINTYGDPEDKNGVMVFTIPQPLPQPDKILMIKIVNDKALLAPSEDAIKQLERVIAAPVDNSKEYAELAMGVPALKRQFGKQAEAALMLGAEKAAESMEGLKTVTQQLDAIQKNLWDLDTLNLRVEFGKESKSATVELSATPLKDTGLAEFLSRKFPLIQARQMGVLKQDAPILFSLGVNGQGTLNLLNGFVGKEHVADRKTLMEFLDGEISGSVEPHPFSFLLAEAGQDKAAQIGAIYQLILDGLLSDADEKHTTPNSLFGGDTETKDGVTINKPKAKQDGLDNIAATLPKLTQAPIDGGVIFSIGDNSTGVVAAGLARAKNPTAAEQVKSVFGAPAAGTIALVSLKTLQLLNLAGDSFPKEITAEQLTGGLEDEPVSIGAFVNAGRAGLRFTLPGATGGSYYRMYNRLKHANIDLMQIVNDALKGSAPKGAGAKEDVVAPPPPK